ncbi:MAG TPA: hypothetical protein VGM29_15550, partial [Polyangiaceae bacterium]
ADGMKAFEGHDYARALGELGRASLLVPDPRIEVYLARTHVALGQLLDGAAAYQSAVDESAAREPNPALTRARELARDELAELRPRIPAIEIAIDEALHRARSVRLELDGRQISTDAQLPVDPGRHDLVARDTEGDALSTSFEIAEGESKTIPLSWHAQSARGSGAPFAPANSTSTRKTLGVVALGVGSTGLGVGTVTGISALSRYSFADRHCPAGHCTEGTPVPDDHSAFRDLKTISAAGFVVGAAGIGTWFGLLVTTPTATATSEHPHVSPWTPVVGVGSAGARYVF